jgi:peptidoglycan/LPS O-acetylase OafA/YrhL
MLNISLDIARGLAALWVFVYHMRLGIEQGVVRRIADGGFLGVPLFFVISGYCMMASSRGTMLKQQTAWAFLKRRLRRIFPPFWASLVVIVTVPFLVAVFYAWRGAPLRWPEPGWLQYTFGDWLRVATLTRGLFSTGAAHKPWSAVNSVYWSLAIEVQFYLVMALALAFRRRFSLILGVVTVGGVVYWRNAPCTPGLFPQYWLMFWFGILLYWVLERGFRPSRLFGRWTVAASAVTGLAAAGVALGITLAQPSETLERQMLFALLCGLALWSASGIESLVPRRALPVRASVGLGKMTYSVYLLHIQLVSMMTTLVRVWVPKTNPYSPALCIAVTLPVLWVFYTLCEKRFATAPARKSISLPPRVAVEAQPAG